MAEEQKIAIDKNELKYLSKLYKLFYENEDGKNLLKDWEQMFLFAPTIPPLGKYKEYPDYYSYLREGQNSFVRDVMVKVKLFKAYLEGQNNDRTSE